MTCLGSLPYWVGPGTTVTDQQMLWGWGGETIEMFAQMHPRTSPE